MKQSPGSETGQVKSLVKQSVRSARNRKGVCQSDKLVNLRFARCETAGEHGLLPGLITRENLSWIRMTRTAKQEARRSGKEDAGHSLLLEGCLFGFYREHNCKNRKGSCRDVT